MEAEDNRTKFSFTQKDWNLGNNIHTSATDFFSKKREKWGSTLTLLLAGEAANLLQAEENKDSPGQLFFFLRS